MPIGDAFGCSQIKGNPEADVFITLAEEWGSSAVYVTKQHWPSVAVTTRFGLEYSIYVRITRCQDANNSAAMNDNDVKDEPQNHQAVEYDHRVATRTFSNTGVKLVLFFSRLVPTSHLALQRTGSFAGVLEALAASKAAGKNFFIAAGIRKPHLSWRTPKQFWDLCEYGWPLCKSL